MLLITQLANQDPLDPLDDRDFIEQMATLNTLTETIDMNENIMTLNLLESAALVGREIEAVGPNGEHVQGTVTEVWFIDNEPWLTIDGETVVNLETVVKIA
jgi:flagellar basal-body rod modification protein FlgD